MGRGVVQSAAAAAGCVSSLLAFGATTTRIPCGPVVSGCRLPVFRGLLSSVGSIPRLACDVGEFLPETSSVERPHWSLVRQRFCGRTERLPHGQPFLVRAHCGVRGRSGLCWLVWLCSRLVGPPWRLVFLLVGLSGLFPCKRV